MEYLLFALFVLVTAFTFARVEIEIEGPHGWAEKLPTWRISNRWTKLFYGSRPLTGYHLWMQLFVVLMAHLPFGLSAWHLTWGRELQVVGFIMLFFVIEDFLWFVLVTGLPPAAISPPAHLVARPDVVVDHAALLLGLHRDRAGRVRARPIPGRSRPSILQRPRPACHSTPATPSPGSLLSSRTRDKRSAKERKRSEKGDIENDGLILDVTFSHAVTFSHLDCLNFKSTDFASSFSSLCDCSNQPPDQQPGGNADCKSHDHDQWHEENHGMPASPRAR